MPHGADLPFAGATRRGELVRGKMSTCELVELGRMDEGLLLSPAVQIKAEPAWADQRPPVS
ncbi:MAG: hypothetical protein M3375_06165 [Actinomycetota bacterium]|nr:hypothetical protein [Actinomycetota bacterium]